MFDLDIWPCDNILLPWWFEKKSANKIIFWSHVTQKRSSRTSQRSRTFPIRYFCQWIFWNQPEVSVTSGSKVMAQNVIFMVFDVFDLDLDISRSFDFCAFTIFPCMTDVIFEGISSLLAEIYNIEIWKNSLYFIMGIFRCHGNVRYVFLIDAIFCKVHRYRPK